MHFNNLTLRFVPDVLQPVVAYKPPKGSDAFPRRELGEITRNLIKAWDAPPPPFPSKEEAAKAEHGKPKAGALDVAAMGRQLAARALQVKEDKPKLQKVIEEAMAGTDCGDCGYPDCFGYSDAIAQGKDFSSEKCAPGGADSKAMLETILVSLKTGVVPTPAAPAPGAPSGSSESPAAAGTAEAVNKGPPLAQTLSKDELYKVVLDAMAGTDCGDCEYADCDGYSKGIVYEGQTDLNRCAPGGEDTRVKLYEIMLGTKPPAK
jgi:Na+-translocating ferredoxin:NAD+ oxidoreductase RNF subunit RnfB